MGHERLGLLPKTKRWTELVDLISSYSSESNVNVEDVARKTLGNVQQQIARLDADTGIKSTFYFLVYLSYAAKSPDPLAFLESIGITLSNKPSHLQIMRALDKWIAPHTDSQEYVALARQAAFDTICTWHQKNNATQLSLFETNEFSQVWENASTGSGFCEVARIYFSKFTERYLNYFLEREASSVIPNVAERNHFKKNMSSYIEDVSLHAFEIAKITQSYAAGWFNKHAKDQCPSTRTIDDFLSYASKKIRSEITRAF